MGSSHENLIVRERLFGHYTAPYVRSKNKPVGHDVEVHKKFEFVSLNINWFEVE
jgi:hypothetical protein